MRRAILVAFAAVAACACRPAGHQHAPALASGAPVHAPKPSLADQLSGGALDLAGAGPAWTLRIRPGSLTLDRPGHPEVVTANPGPQMLGDAAAWDAPPSADQGLLIVTLTPGACVIEGSGATYPFHAAVEADGDRLIGCGAPAK